MGDRQIFRCKNCGRKFTPQNQPTGDTAEKTASTAETVPVAAVPAAVESTAESPVVPAETATPSENEEKVIDHPRY
jgi:transposase-like protein